MPNVPPPLLTRTADRARAAAIVSRALHLTAERSFALVDTVDAVAAAVLHTAGADDATTRAALAEMFARPHGTTPAARAAGASRLADRDREFLRGLGQRLHAVRTARQIEPPEILRATGIRSDQLTDLERGIAAPTILALHRLAEALQAPLPLLLDDTRPPLELLLALVRHDHPPRDDSGTESEDSP